MSGGADSWSSRLGIPVPLDLLTEAEQLADEGLFVAGSVRWQHPTTTLVSLLSDFAVY